MLHEDKRTTLLRKRAEAESGGGEDKIAKHHERGKLTARERITALVDPGTFVEIDAFVTHDCQDFGMADKKVLGDGVITGWGEVDGRLIYLFAHDFTVFGGSLSAMFARKVCKIYDLAEQNGAPIIGLNDSGGARIHEGVASLGGYADIFFRNTRASGVVPQLSIVMGPCAGGAVYSPAITDFTFMVDNTSHMFITGPDVIKTVTGETISFDELGGSETHTAKSGVCDLRFPTEIDAIFGIKKWLSYVPSSNAEQPPTYPAPEQTAQLDAQRENLQNILPEKPNMPYDVRQVIENIADPGSFWELGSEHAPNLVTGFARLGGLVVGTVANNPQHMAGVLDIEGSIKGARFVRFCDAFSIPILTLVDVPGFLPGSDQEHRGIIRHGAKLLYAYCEASVPQMTVILRKAYGGAYDVMCSKHIGCDINLAWPTAEIAVMGPQGACEIIFRGDIKKAKNPEARKAELIADYTETFATPYIASAKGFIDAVILPEETREYLIRSLTTLRNKRVTHPKRKHGNIPL